MIKSVGQPARQEITYLVIHTFIFLWLLSNRILPSAQIASVYFRQGRTCTLGLTIDLIDGDQPRTKPHLRKAKPNHVLKTVFSPQLVNVYQVAG